MKVITSALIAILATMLMAGCAQEEAAPEVPIAKPTDDGPQPASVSGAAGAAPAPAAGASQAPSTE